MLVTTNGLLVAFFGPSAKISFFCGLAVYLIYILIYAIAGVSILSLAALDY